MSIKIETQRLILRNYQESDIDDYFDYVSDPNVANRLWGEPHNKKSAMERLKLEIAKPLQFAITLKPKDKVIGSVELMNIGHPERYVGINLPPDCKEIGYLLSPKFWGQGIMPEAVAGVLFLAFNELGYDMVAIGHNKANTQSGRVQEKLGFKIVSEVTLPESRPWIDGKIYPSVRRLMTKQEYKTNPKLKNFKVKIENK